MKILIKNMVCDRCKMVVNAELEKLGIHPTTVDLGEVTLDQKLPSHQLKLVDTALKQVGFLLIDNKKNQLIEKIKKLIIDLVHQQDGLLKANLSDHLSSVLNYDYHYISTLFSEIEGTTIEKYFIAQKIEKVKELLIYDELTLSEIAHHLHYSSVAHLSNQFKKVTGLSPSHFKNSCIVKRKSLDQV